MLIRTPGRLAAAGVFVAAAVMTTSCSGGSSGGDNSGTQAQSTSPPPVSATSTSDCPSSITATASTPLPSNMPAPQGASTAYQYSKQGKTQVWFFAVDGGPEDLASIRDSYDKALTAKGYRIKDTDQEERSEAESEFGGPHEGTTNVRPACTGKVTVRLKLES